MKRMSEKRKRPSNVSEVDERERVKESILRVFRDRYQSPSKGGAVAIGQPRQNAQSQESSPEETMSSRSRPKRKSSRQKKSATKKTSPAAVKSDTAVSKHMKVAHGIVYNYGKDRNEGSTINRIAPSRLTQKLGIFNLGKRSRPATRGLFVPEHIQQQTEADIKRIIQEVHMDSPEPCDTSSMPHISETHSKPVDISTSKMVDTASWVSDTKTPNSKNNSFIVASKTVHRSGTSSSDCTMEKSPEVLSIRDTLHEILVPLGPLTKQMFPKRDCLKETLSCLQKLLKQKRPRKSLWKEKKLLKLSNFSFYHNDSYLTRGISSDFDSAPRSATPTPIPTLDKIRSSGGIQRTLFMDSCHPHTSNSVKSPAYTCTGVSSDRRHQKQTGDIFSAQPLEQYVVSAPIANYPQTRLFDKMTNQHTQSSSYKPIQGDGDHRKSEHDIHYYRSKVLGTERRGGLFNSGNGQDLFTARPTNTKDGKHTSTCIQNNIGNSLDLFPSSRDKETKDLMSLQQNRTYLHGNSNGREGNKSLPVVYRDMGFESNNDICMKPRDDFSAFFKDFKLESKRYGIPENHQRISENHQRILENHQRISKRPVTPVDDHLLKITRPISPLRDREPLSLLGLDRGGNPGPHYEPMDCETRKEDDAMGLLEKNDLMETINKERLSQEEKCCCGELRCNNHNASGPSSHTANNKMMYMPGFHSDFYTDHLSAKDILWQKPGLYAKGESMDMLDQMDLDMAMEVQHPRHHYRPESRDILHVAPINTEPTSLWKSSYSHRELRSECRKPAVTQEDSPGIIMLPRKMY